MTDRTHIPTLIDAANAAALAMASATRAETTARHLWFSGQVSTFAKDAATKAADEATFEFGRTIDRLKEATR